MPEMLPGSWEAPLLHYIRTISILENCITVSAILYTYEWWFVINNGQSILSPSAAKYCFLKNPDLYVSLIHKSIRAALISSGSLIKMCGKGINWQTKATLLEYDCGDEV